MAPLALSEILGVPVEEPAGTLHGRVREVAICPQEDRARVHGLVVRTSEGDRLLPREGIAAVTPRRVRAALPSAEWPAFAESEGMLLLDRDLLDQQIIDVHGRKVVRVNDVDLEQKPSNGGLLLRIAEVDVGARGAVRRLLRGVVPSLLVERLVARIPPRIIPWDFVDLIETDPARRVKLKISHDRLGRLHPADIADIVEELSPAEREAVFETLDEEVAAEALEEVHPKLQVSIVESLDSDRAADIVEEMDPDAAANLLKDLPEETSEVILEEMAPYERQDVSELLQFEEDTAAGHMTTEFVAMPRTARVYDAIELLRHYEGGIESLSAIYVVGQARKLLGVVPLARMVLAPPNTQLGQLMLEPVACPAGAKEKEIFELFDKYNLLSLPVVDKGGSLTGVITADDVITLMRAKL
jgi:CBS domain-containing protein/sporulation protein YlmC with PRC-barrel domain